MVPLSAWMSQHKHTRLTMHLMCEPAQHRAALICEKLTERAQSGLICERINFVTTVSDTGTCHVMLINDAVPTTRPDEERRQSRLSFLFRFDFGNLPGRRQLFERHHTKPSFVT